MYAGDSFFTLSSGGQAGLLLLSGVLAAAMVLLTRWAARGRRLVSRVLIACGLFVAFVWLSPQVYYLFYRAIIDGLPLQWVAPRVPDPGQALDIALLRHKATLSSHGQAILGLLMLAGALTANLDRRGVRSHQGAGQSQGGHE